MSPAGSRGAARGAGRDPHPALRGGPLGFAHRGWTPPTADPAVSGAEGTDHAEDGLAHEAHVHAWENTLPAFQAAVDLGLRHLETDVHATSDGVAVVVHDPDLARTAGHPGSVADLTWAQVQQVRVAGLHPVPRIEEVLEAFPGTVLNIDVKDPRAVAPLAAAVRAAGAQERVLVASFDGRRAAAVQRLVPGVARSAGMAGTAAARLAASVAAASDRLGSGLLRLATRGVDALQVPEHAGGLRVVTPRLLALAHDVGLQVHVWTVDDTADMERLLDLGVDGLMSDRADLLSQVLSGRAG